MYFHCSGWALGKISSWINSRRDFRAAGRGGKESNNKVLSIYVRALICLKKNVRTFTVLHYLDWFLYQSEKSYERNIKKKNFACKHVVKWRSHSPIFEFWKLEFVVMWIHMTKHSRINLALLKNSLKLLICVWTADWSIYCRNSS